MGDEMPRLNLNLRRIQSGPPFFFFSLAEGGRYAGRKARDEYLRFGRDNYYLISFHLICLFPGG